jgi:hypothetical protein
MTAPVKVELKPCFEPEFITVWMSMADSFAQAAEAIREAGERLAELYETSEDDEEAHG